MPYRNRSSRCTTLMPDHSFCDDPALPDAPVSVCLTHAGRLLEYLSDRVAEDGDDLRDALDRLVRVGDRQHDDEVAQLRPQRASDGGDLVYYLMLGGLVKIGTTAVDLPRRLRGYPPHTEVLATEPGDYRVERRRLEQFRHLLAYRRSEWHYYGRDLADHIDGLRLTCKIA